MPLSKLGHSERKDELVKQHACITTFEGLMRLREEQAKKSVKRNRIFHKKKRKQAAIPYGMILI
jgi:hypothetical protein